MSKCVDCNLYNTCKSNKIDGVGSSNPDIMIVLDHPARVEDNFGRLIQGEIKKKLYYFLKKAGINPADVFFTSAIRCKPINPSDIKAKNINACRKYLLYDIKEVKPKIVIAMGKYAHWALTDKQSVREFRGHFDELSFNYGKKEIKVPIMPSFGVNASLGKWEYDDYIIHDLKKAKKFISQGLPKLKELPKFKTVLNLKDLAEFEETMMSKEVKWSTSDLETTGFKFFKDAPFMHGYCTNNDDIFVIPTLTYKKHHIKKWDKENIERGRVINRFVKEHRLKIMATIRRVNARKDIKWIFHNGKFDVNFARYHKVPYSDLSYDTLLADSLIDENKQHALNICMEYRGLDFGAYDSLNWQYVNKDEDKQKTYQNIPPLICERYLAIDVYGLKEMFPITVKELKADGLYDHFMQVKMKALKLMTGVEYKGVKGDRKLLSEINEILTEKINSLVKEAREYTKIEDFNMGSPQQLNKFFEAKNFPMEKLGIKQTKTGYSTSKEELEKFIKFKKWGVLPKIVIEYKKYTKLAGTYVEGKIGSDEDGGMLKHFDQNDRIHTNFNLWTPRTGRYSSNKPSLQVWPRPVKGLPNIRNIIIPTDENHMLFEADYRAVEQYVVALLSKDPVLTKRLQDGTDIHTYNAVELGKKLSTMPDEITYNMMLSMVKDLEETSLTEEEYLNYQKQAKEIAPDMDWKEKRTQAKTIGFGLNYGKGGHSYSEEFGITEDEAEEMIEAYFSIYKGMKKWRKEVIAEALNEGFITLPSGRRRRFHQATDWINSRYASDDSNESGLIWQANNLRQSIERQASNAPIQGGAHEVFEPAQIRVAKRFQKEGIKARIMLSIHDGIIGECLRTDAEKVSKILSEEMPVTFNKGTKSELTLDIDKDFYKWEWYGETVKI